MPEISLIICTRNRDDMISDVLKSAKNQTLEPDKYEVVIIDQSINDKTQDLLQDYPEFKYIRLNSKGASISRNEGIKQSQGNILVYIDDDILYESNYLETILNFFNNSEYKPDMIGGKTHIKVLGEKPAWLDGPLLGILAHSDYGDNPMPYDSHPKHIPYTCNMAIKRECIDKVGGFSEFICNLIQKYPINEDVMFALKVRNAGFNVIYYPEMFVYHRMPASRLTYEYYKEKYHSHGISDAYLHKILNMFKLTDMPQKLLLHSLRMIEGLVFQHFQKNLTDKYYQKLRFYYNLGYLKALITILFKKGKLNEDS